MISMMEKAQPICTVDPANAIWSTVRRNCRGSKREVPEFTDPP
jgi:hypothetical protein